MSSIAGRRRVLCFLISAAWQIHWPSTTSPAPNAISGFVGQLVAQLPREHNDLSTMVGLVRKHVAEHGCASGPGGGPTATGKLLNVPGSDVFRERVLGHFQASCRALLMSRALV